MDLKEALNKATQILDEERKNPTVSYEPQESKDGLDHNLPGTKLLRALERIDARRELQDVRAKRPRPVLENPRQFAFRSTNYDLLCALLSRVAEQERPHFVHGVLLRIISTPACGRAKMLGIVPSWNQLISELPLVEEFGVRNGGKEQFFRILGEARALPGHVILLQHLEDMIALNYTVFSDPEYERLALAVQNFQHSTKSQAEDFRKKGVFGAGGNVEWSDIGTVNLFSQAHEIIAAADSIVEECRKARYLYLKGVLLEGLNLEVNQDKDTVESYLQQFGFSKSLQDCLNEADRLYQASATAFDLKSGMGHLRSFMESLHAEAIRKLVAKAATLPPSGWGPGLAFLRQNDVLSVAEEKFAAGLYGLISDQAVHPLIAQREYARLAQNMVIEYALLFLRKLEKLGLALGQEAASS